MTSLLRVYRWCAQFRWPSSYVGKFLLIAFIGVHIPLVAMTVYVVLSLESWTLAMPVLIVGLLATLFGTVATLLFQQQLLAPVIVTAEAIERYTHDRTLPALPTIYTDEAGRLMQNTQLCIAHLDQLLTMKNDLLAVISHDTRAPLANIVLASQMIDLLLKNPQANHDEIRQFNALIRSAASRQVDMMNSLMSLARADTGRLDVQRKAITLRELLDTAIADNRLRADHKGIHLIQSGTIDPQQMLYIDGAKTGQVLNNLIQNALKFTDNGGTVQLKARVTGDQLSITVRDTGVGMDQAVLKNLFQPFTIERRPGTAGEPGSGLGLWICKTFIEVQGGTISVDSSVGNGTTFEIRLPTRIADSDSSAHSNLTTELAVA